MKRNKYPISILLLTVCILATVISSCSSLGNKNREDKIPVLLERKGELGPKEETESIKQAYNKADSTLKINPDDMKQYLALASVFITEGRITGNGNYYSNAAAKMLDKVINNGATQDQKFQAYSLKSAVLLNMHQFKDALDAANKGVAIDSFNSGIHGALVDANVELGNYDEAVKECDKMLSIRPDLRSYSRASYLRQIYGDNAGAIFAMNLAVQAGVPGVESTEWARVNLGDLYLNIGNVDSASILYRTALVYRPAYAFAEMGMARVEKAKKNYAAAIEHAKSAIKIISEVAFVSYLGDLYELQGNSAKAAEVHDDVVKLLLDGEKDQPADAPIKHNISREMAMAYLADNKLDKALEYAQTDLKMRPENIDANNLAAWIYYLKGDYANAKTHADKMLHTNTKNADRVFEAGNIYAAAGDPAKGNALVQQAKAISPYIDQKIMNESKIK
jgi:tetratricopeptide (TPR) repeat protein